MIQWPVSVWRVGCTLTALKPNINNTRRKQMKAVLTLSNGQKVIADVVLPPIRKRFEAQKELENRVMESMNKAQPNMVNKIVNVHLTRN